MTRSDATPGGVRVTEEERMLIARCAELSARAEYTATASPFLSPRQQRIVLEDAVRRRCAGQLFLWGGCPGAERRMAVYLPAWILSFAPQPAPAFLARPFAEEREMYFLSLLKEAGVLDAAEPGPDGQDNLPAALPTVLDGPAQAETAGMLSEFIHPLLLEGSGFRALSHRDWLGSLMSLGVKREILGDIVVWDECHAVVFCQAKGAAYLIGELRRAGRDAVRASYCRLPQGFVPTRQYAPVRTTVASPRADGVVRALCNVSREDAVELIQRGFVEINYEPVTEVDGQVAAGDVISVRGHGKFQVDAINEPTQRGRIHLVARKYQ